MKKKLFLLICVIFLVGCTPIQNMSIEDVINNGVETKYSLSNEYRSGYKYYLPKGLKVTHKNDYNETIKGDKYQYYLYVDVISYYNHVISTYKTKDYVYYSNPINYQDKYGYLEIKSVNESKYLIEIMYNYAKIEVIVDEEDINTSIASAISVLNSVKYNDTILTKLIGDETSSFNEYEFNIFETTKDSTYLEYVNNDNTTEEDEHDSDLVN